MESSETDLLVDQVYGGSRRGNAGDDPLPQLIGVDSGAGFRHLGRRPHTETLRLLALISSFKEPDWPDHLDRETGVFTYYGDNRTPGDLHDTPRQGNAILRNLFDAAHDQSKTDRFPAILLFGGTGTYRDMRFLGLAVPGASGLSADEDLVAIWRTKGDENARFQNYRAKFTVLDVGTVPRAWLNDIKNGVVVGSSHAPPVWVDWVRYRKYTPLLAPSTVEIRSKNQQLPNSKENEAILNLVYAQFADSPHDFEYCAAQIAQLLLPAIADCDVTRPWRDGGRDAIGRFLIGGAPSGISIDFALEAKCYAPTNGVGVRELSRLISRLRYRQFGILVTTSYLGRQAYTELKEDGHPVIVVCGADIVEILRTRIGSHDGIRTWLAGVAKRQIDAPIGHPSDRTSEGSSDRTSEG